MKVNEMNNSHFVKPFNATISIPENMHFNRNIHFKIIKSTVKYALSELFDFSSLPTHLNAVRESLTHLDFNAFLAL